MPNVTLSHYWKVLGALLTFALLLANAPLAFADVKAVVTIECDPHNDQVVFAQASSGSPVQSLPSTKCTDAMVYLDAQHFKVKETLRGVSATTINEVPFAATGNAAWHSNYLYVFFLD
jgi:hypothetical protein